MTRPPDPFADARAAARAASGEPDPVETVVTVLVPPGQQPGTRLDVYLTARLPNATRTRVQRGIREGRVSVNGRVEVRPSWAVQPGDVLACRILRPPPLEIAPEPIPLAIVYEDDALIVLDKPAGMVVHPAYGHRSGTLVNALLHHVGAGPLTADALAGSGGGPDGDDELGEGGDPEGDDGPGLALAGAGPRYAGDPTIRPGLVHRLDKDTTGLMVVAKTDAALAALGAQFAARTIRREYVALVWGVPDPPEGRLETFLGRDPRDRKRIAVVPEGRGKHAATTYAVEEAFQHLALVRFRLETGRTHQIRVHARHLGHPVFGDATYGGDRIRYGPAVGARRQFFAHLLRRLPRQALHARTLGFRHPVTGEALDFEAPVPRDMALVTDRIRRVEG
ncbi:MAG: pseudouridine synthase [Rubricoccaceae bacterium]